jgi:DNA-directed RNA polymerase III subunit RPC6
MLPTLVLAGFVSFRYNRLLQFGRLHLAQRITQDAGGETKRVVVYKWVSPKNAQRLAGLSPAERMAYDLIAKSRNDGQTRKDIKSKTNIQNNVELKGMLERLVARNLIKEIKSVLSSNKRVFILAELEASQSHTGGPWYGDDQDFDQEFIVAVYEFAKSFIEGRKSVTVADVTKFVAESGICNDALEEEDIRKLMFTMLHDGQIERCVGEGDAETQYYSVATSLPLSSAHMEQPCFRCPVASDCKPGGVISPTTCAYMDDWLATAPALDW